MRRALIGSTGLALALGLGLAGCGSTTEEGLEEAIEQETGGDVEVEDDGVTFSDDEGNEVKVGSAAEVPEGWPDDIPVPEGTVLGSTTAGGTSTIIMTVEEEPQKVYNSLKGELESNGWTTESDTAIGGLYGGAFTKDGRTASVAVLDDGSGGAQLTLSSDAA